MQHAPFTVEFAGAFELARLVRLLQPSQFATDTLGFTPDPIQQQVLDSTTSRLLLCCSRQWGKSTTTAARAVYEASVRPGALILIAAPGSRQSAEVFLRCASFLARVRIARRGDGLNPISFLLPNGSRIVGLPNSEATIRGFSAPAFLLIDEASRVPDALYHALLPMLATNPKALVWILSTPHGRQGFFYHEWASATTRFERVTVTADDCPRIPRDFLEEQAATLPRHLFEQEYLCKFHSPEGSLLTDEEVTGAIDPEATPIL